MSVGAFLFATTPEARVFRALLPALVATLVFLLAVPVFAIRCLLFGVPRDDETEKRGDSLLVGFFLRYYFFWLTRPVFRLLVRSKLPAQALTTLSVLLGAGAGAAVAAGRFALGGWLFLSAGVLDALDGRLARAQASVSPAGAALDSVLDRYTDSFFLIGLAWYYRDTWVLLPVLFALLGTSLVPYVRARGEGLGVSIKTGIMQRLERVLVLGASVALSPILEAIFAPDRSRPMHRLAAGGIIVLAIASNATALARFFTLLRALGARAAGLPRYLLSSVYSLSLAAVLSEFAIVSSAVELFRFGPVAASAIAGVIGSLLELLLRWLLAVVRPSAVSFPPPAGRFFLASSAKVLLTAGGMALLSSYPALDYRVAWWITRGAVWLAWSFPLRRYLFLSRSTPRSPNVVEGSADGTPAAEPK